MKTILFIFILICLNSIVSSSRLFDEDKPQQRFQQEQEPSDDSNYTFKKSKQNQEQEEEDPAEQIRKMMIRSKLPKEFQSLEEIPPEDDGIPMFKESQLPPEDSEFWKKEQERLRLDENGNEIPKENIIDTRTDSTIEIFRKMLAGMKNRYTERSCEVEKREFVAKITARAQELIDASPDLRVLWTTPDVKNMKPEFKLYDDDEDEEQEKIIPIQDENNNNNNQEKEKENKQKQREIKIQKPIEKTLPSTFKEEPDGQYEDEDDFS